MTLPLLFSHSVVSDSLQPHGLQHTRIPCPSLSPRVCSNSCPFESMMPSNHLVLCCPLLLLSSIFLNIRVFSSGLALHVMWPKIGASVLVMVFPMNIQGRFPLGLTGLISLLSRGLSRVLSSTSSKASVFRCSAFFMFQLSHLYMTIGKAITLTI